LKHICEEHTNIQLSSTR